MEAKNQLSQRNDTLHRVAIRFRRNWQIYLFILPAMVYFIVFHYFPMYGIQIAFRDYRLTEGITGGNWVGLKYFQKFFSSYYCSRLITNTLLLNVLGLFLGFPFPIVMALLLNRLSTRFKKFTQTVIYIPHFISTVVLAGMIYIMFGTNGIANKLVTALGGDPILFMAEASWFRPIYIGSAIWQGSGWGTILYIAALTSVDPEIYEAATIDGASLLQKIRHIDIPTVIPIATMMLILNMGSLLGGDTQKVLLLQTAGNKAVSDIIGVYVYNMGLTQGQFSYTAAIGLFQNLIGCIMVLTVNTIAKKAGQVSMF
ncbi:MAG: ABC transporter permease [Aristaeellaceae bacterium]